MPNRNLVCGDCGETKWLSQKQFRERVGKEGTPTKAKRRFRCAKCRSLEKKNPFAYQIKYGKPIKKLRSSVRKAVYKFYETGDLVWLKTQISEIFTKNDIDPNSITYHYTGNRIDGFTINGVPFVGNIYVSLYTQRKYEKLKI